MRRSSVFVLGVLFVISLAINWSGTHAFIDKSELPALLFEGVDGAENLKKVMLELRNEVYRYYKDTGSENIVISAYHGYVEPLQSHPVTLRLEGRDVTVPSLLINELRGCLLLNPNDEANALRALYQMKPRRGDFNPHIFQYGGIFIYLLGPTLWFASKIGLFVLNSNVAYYIDHPDQMARLYASGEMFVGFFAALGIFPLYALGKSWRGPRVALVACLFYPFVPLFAILSHHMKPHALAIPVSLLAVHLCLKAQLEPPARRNYFLAGLLCGFTIGIVYTSVFMFLVLLAAYALNARWREATPGLLVLGLAGVGLGFLVFNPYYVISPKEPIQELITLFSRHVHPTSFLDKVQFFFGGEVQRALGWFPFLLALAGLLTSARDRTPGNGLMLAATLLSIVPTLLNRGDAYYSGPTFAFLLLWIGCLAEKFVVQRRSVAMALVFAFAIAYAALQQGVYASLFRQKEPAYALGRWIDENVRPGSSIVRIQQTGAHPLIPFRIWRYVIGFPARELPLDANGFPSDAGDELIRLDNAPADYALMTCGRQLPARLKIGRYEYALAAEFRRSSRLQKFFELRMFPYSADNFYHMFYIYELKKSLA